MKLYLLKAWLWIYVVTFFINLHDNMSMYDLDIWLVSAGFASCFTACIFAGIMRRRYESTITLNKKDAKDMLDTLQHLKYEWISNYGESEHHVLLNNTKHSIKILKDKLS